MTTLTRGSPVGEPERGRGRGLKGFKGSDRNILARSLEEQTSALRTVKVEVLHFMVVSMFWSAPSFWLYRRHLRRGLHPEARLKSSDSVMKCAELLL